MHPEPRVPRSCAGSPDKWRPRGLEVILPLARLQHSWLSESALERQRGEEGCG